MRRAPLISGKIYRAGKRGFFKRSEEMSTIQPKGEKIRQAVKWISDTRKDGESRPLSVVVQEAALQFNLSPKEEEFLMSFYEQDLR
jgi:hypothetical protein